MQLIRRASSLPAVALLATGFIYAPAAPPPDVHILPPDVQLVSFTLPPTPPIVPGTLGYVVDEGIGYVDNFFVNAAIAVGYFDAGLLSDAAQWLDQIGATALASTFMTWVDGATDTEHLYPFLVAEDWLEWLVADLGLNSIKLGSTSSGHANAIIADQTNFSSLINDDITRVEESLGKSLNGIGLFDHGAIADTDNGVEHLGGTALAPEMMPLAADAGDAKMPETPIADIASWDQPIIADLDLN